ASDESGPGMLASRALACRAQCRIHVSVARRSLHASSYEHPGNRPRLLAGNGLAAIDAMQEKPRRSLVRHRECSSFVGDWLASCRTLGPACHAAVVDRQRDPEYPPGDRLSAAASPPPALLLLGRWRRGRRRGRWRWRRWCRRPLLVLAERT